MKNTDGGSYFCTAIVSQAPRIATVAVLNLALGLQFIQRLVYSQWRIIMSKKPNTNKIKKILQRGVNFKLSREEYIKLTGADIPQNKNYTERKSAVAKLADEYGFRIIVIPEQLMFEKKK